MIKKHSMKKYILIILVLFVNVLAKAQSSFDSLETNTNVNAVVVNKKMFELMAKIKVDGNDTEAQNYLTLIKNLDYLRVLSTTDANTSSLLISTANNYLAKNPLQQQATSTNNGKNVKMYVKFIGKGDIVSELLMFIEDQKNKNNITIMTLSGNFSINSISILTDKMNLPVNK